MTRQFHIGAQNDALFIISGERPATTNDYPRHDADRTCIAKVYDEAEARRLVDAANAGLASAPQASQEALDAEALRTAVRLNLHAARTSGCRVSCWAEKAPFDSDEPGHDTHREVSECWFGPDMREYAERYGHNWRADQLSATRLVIELAAAAIAKGPSHE